MGIFDIFGKGNKINYYNHLLNLYNYLSHTHNLHYYQKSGFFQVLTRIPPSGIIVHTPLSDKIYNVLIDQYFQHMMIGGELDGIRIYESHSPEQVTFYISFHSILGYKILLHIFKENGIHVKPKLKVHKNKSGSYVLLNRMYISKDAYVRYFIYFHDRKDNHPKIDDSKWRSAADSGHPQILAVSRSYLLNHLYNLNYEDNSHIITFLSLMNYNGIKVPLPNIILSLSSNKLITYNIYLARINEYDLSTHRDLIIDNPEEVLRAFLQQWL